PRSLSRMSSASRFSVQMRDVFVPAENVLADPAAEYIYRIRSGFILLQAGMGMGLIRDCISSMRQERRGRAHVNRYVERQPEGLDTALSEVEREVQWLSTTPFETDAKYFRR